MENNYRIALLVDGDNISPKYLPAVMHEMQKRGTCFIKRIYGDWTSASMSGWKDCLQEFGVRPMQQFRYGVNSTDNAIIMDAMEILLSAHRIECFCIVSSDGGFHSLCQRIRESGRFVIGIGDRKTKPVLQRSCDEFVFLDNLSIEESKSLGTINGEALNPERLLSRAYLECSSDGEWVPFSKLGFLARKLIPSFDPRTYNHSSFKSLIESLDIFEVTGDDRIPPNWFCRLKEKPPGEQERGRGSIKRFLSASFYGFIAAEDGDYYFTRANLKKEQQHLELTPGMPVIFDIVKRPDPDGLKPPERNGRAGNVEIIALPKEAN
jgi:uncharacterized LabA/DUF88 family protein